MRSQLKEGAVSPATQLTDGCRKSDGLTQVASPVVRSRLWPLQEVQRGRGQHRNACSLRPNPRKSIDKGFPHRLDHWAMGSVLDLDVPAIDAEFLERLHQPSHCAALTRNHRAPATVVGGNGNLGLCLQKGRNRLISQLHHGHAASWPAALVK